MFDVDFNRKLIKIFLYLLIEAYDELSQLNEESSLSGGERLLQNEISDQKLSSLYSLFPHGFARQRITNYKWMRTRREKAMTRNVSITPRYESSVAQSVRDISVHGMNTPSASVHALGTPA